MNLRPASNTLALRWMVRELASPAEPLQLVPELWVDGQPLVDFSRFGVELALLWRSAREAGEFFLITCWCGVPECAGLRRPVVVRHTPKQVCWRVTEPVAQEELRFEADAYRCALDEGMREGLAWLAQASAEEPLALVPASNLRFLQRHAAPVQPVADAAMFQRIVRRAARLVGATVEAIEHPGVTPNFHAARLRWPAGPVLHLLASWDGHWACVQELEPGACRLHFINPPESLSAALMQVAEVLVFDREELAADFTPQPGMSEADLRYWQPHTLGEGLFNWWD